jgi:RHS repeat-associated protein
MRTDGPRDPPTSDVTEWQYYASTDECAPSRTDLVSSTIGCRGLIKKITNALGHVTEFNRYNAHGQPEEIKDPNGVVITLGYDARQRLTSQNVGGELTTYEYYPTGLLETITAPDGAFLYYAYDDAHRLTSIEDNLDNRLEYTPDPMGNWTTELTKDAAGTVVRTRTRVYDTLNRLEQEVGTEQPTLNVTRYKYDNNGNLRCITLPRPTPETTIDRRIEQQWDALNRLKVVLKPLARLDDDCSVPVPGAAQTAYDYDAIDQLTSVVDPRGVPTTYVVNGLGNLSQTVSADAGTSTTPPEQFDGAGNPKEITDGRGKKTTYTYDALNRLASMAFQDGTSIVYGYDQGTNGKGRLTSVTFPGGGTIYQYDQQGRVRLKGDAHASQGVQLYVLYEYPSAPPYVGRLTRITYPSGRQIILAYDASGRPSSVSLGSTVIATGIKYFPFGDPKEWTWGSGSTVTREFDQDGRLKSFPLTPSGRRVITYDGASRIVTIENPNAQPPGSTTFSMTYDDLDRLASWTNPVAANNRGYTYDANGNRTSATVGTTTYDYEYVDPPIDNRLLSTEGPAPAKTNLYDGAGNLRNDATAQYYYSDRGRMFASFKGGNWSFYGHDGLGQRVKKSWSSSIIFFAYDEDGKLLGEYLYDNSVTPIGIPIREYVYLGDMPIAVLTGNWTAPEISYIYTDQIDRPWMVTNTLNQIRWRWDTEPFGSNQPNSNPSGLGTFTFPLRFPGQYYDAETGLHYNYFRDYDPQIGRYVQSDPIGLEGGVNTYAYVGSNPLTHSDPTGLEVEVRCRTVGDPYSPGFRAGLAGVLGGEHCYVVVSCPFMKETMIS